MSHKLRAVITVEWIVDKLEHYGSANTIEEAAANQQRYYDTGGIGAEELISWGDNTTVKIEVVS